MSESSGLDWVLERGVTVGTGSSRVGDSVMDSLGVPATEGLVAGVVCCGVRRLIDLDPILNGWCMCG